MPVPQLVYIAQPAYQRIVEEAPANSERETGGILVGRMFAVGDILVLVVVAASGPGPQAILDLHMFAPDTEALQYELDACRREFAAYQVDYVGEWHKHMPGQHQPSAGDTRQVVAILGDADYNLPAGIFTPIGTVEAGVCLLHAYYYPRQTLRPEPVEYTVVEGSIYALLDELVRLEARPEP